MARAARRCEGPEVDGTRPSAGGACWRWVEAGVARERPVEMGAAGGLARAWSAPSSGRGCWDRSGEK